MSIDILHATAERRLEIVIAGDLDLRLTAGILEAAQLVEPGLNVCMIDLAGVQRVFDSGAALLRLLLAKLEDCDVPVVVQGEVPTRGVPIEYAY